MAFTVGLPGGTKDYEFAAYVRQLERQGVNIANTPRVHDPRTGNRWLNAWRDRADAERFAALLRKDTENPSWQVYEWAGVEPSAGPLGPIEILVGRQSDGYTYSLHPTSRKLIRKRYPQTKLTPSVFISTETRHDFETTQGPIGDQIAIILTGLSEQQLKEFSGYRVYDPVNKRVLHEASLFESPTGNPGADAGGPSKSGSG